MKVACLKQFCLVLLLTTVLGPFSATATAEPLKRAPFLGIAPENTNVGEHVTFSRVVPTGTAAGIGAKAGDVVVSINNEPVADFQNFLALIRAIPVGDKFSLKVVRDGGEQVLSGEMLGRQKEQGTGFRSEYGQLLYKNNRLRTITLIPENPRADKAAVFYIQGYTCGTIDYGSVPNLTIQQQLVTYAQAGFVVMKMEKFGVGESDGDLQCAMVDFTTENEAFKHGVSALKEREDVQGDNVFIYGHSLGVIHGAVIGQTGAVKGVMGYGGVLKSWYEYSLDLYDLQATTFFGVDVAEGKENRRMAKPLINAWMNTDRTWEDIMNDPELSEVIESNLLPISEDRVFDRHYSFFRDLNKYDFPSIWKSQKGYAFLMAGTYDIQAISTKWASDIASLMNGVKAGSATSMEFPRTDHSLLRYQNKEQLREATQQGTINPSMPGEYYNQDIAIASLKWMQDILKTDKK